MGFCDKYCRRYKINSLRLKRLLKTQSFEKIGKLSSEKYNLALFFSLIEHVKCQRTIYNDAKGLLRKIVQVVVSIP